MGIVPAEALLAQAKQALGTGGAVEAVALGRQLLRQAPQLAAGYDVLGHAFLATGRPDRALIAFEYVLHLDQTDSDGHYGCGLAHLALEQRDAALQSFRAALARRPGRLDVQGYIEELAPRPAIPALDPSAQSFFAGTDWAGLTSPPVGPVELPSSRPVEGPTDPSAHSFFAGIDWDAIDLPAESASASSLGDDSTVAVEPFDFSDFIPGDLTPFSLDEGELDRAELGSSDGPVSRQHSDLHPSPVSEAASVEAPGEVGAEHVLPVSLLDLGLQNEADQERGSTTPAVFPLADLPEAAPMPAGFTWEPPTWLAPSSAGGTVDDGHESIFAKLVQHQSSQPAADAGQFHPDYFSLDEVELRHPGNAAATGSSQPEQPRPLTINHIVSSNREYLMVNSEAPAEPSDTSPPKRSADSLVAVAPAPIIETASTEDTPGTTLPAPIVGATVIETAVLPLSLADLILGDSDVRLPGIDAAPLSLPAIGLAEADPTPLLAPEGFAAAKEPVQEQVPAALPHAREAATALADPTVRKLRAIPAAEADHYQPKPLVMPQRADIELPQPPHLQEGDQSAAPLQAMDKPPVRDQAWTPLPSSPVDPATSPLAEAQMALQAGRLDEALAAYQQMLEERTLVPVVTAELESMLAGGHQSISARRVRRLLVTAYLKQRRYGAAVTAYLGSIFGG